MSEKITKTPGQLAYEEDVRRKPLYWGCEPRRPWDRISAIARQSWERDPRPRAWGTTEETPDA